MKTRKAIGVALLMVVLASFAYWVDHRHEKSTSRQRINRVNSLRQVGLVIPQDRNDFSASFTITGTVVAAKNQ